MNLTPRQRIVLALIAQGLNNRQIADKMEISPVTVRNYTVQIYQRIGAKNRAQAAVMAIKAARAVEQVC